MAKYSQFAITATVLALTACASNSKHPAAVERDQQTVSQETALLPKRDFVAETKNVSRSMPNYAQRRVVQITSSSQNRGVLVDIQEGPANGVHNVTSRYGENHIVRIARNYPSTIITPFADPQVKYNEEKSKAGVDYFGSTIIVNPQSNHNIWMTIYDLTNPRGLPVTLTLIPNPKLMSQTINVAVEKSPSETANGLQPADGGFAQKLTNILKNIANQKLPAGFTVRPLKEKISISENIKTVPVERYSGIEFDVYRYRITNTGNIRFDFDEGSEEAFRNISKRVRAVAPYPRTTLFPGESTDVLVLVSKKG